MASLRERRPRIGIAPVRATDDAGASEPLLVRAGYIAAVRAGGGLPLLLADTDLAQVDDLVAAVDGLLLPGGGDLHPRFFGEEPMAGYRPMADDLAAIHLALARAAFAARLPCLGICLGCQVMNVALEGTLYQHLDQRRPAAVAHQGKNGDTRHGVSIAPGSRLFTVVGVSQLEVPSRHHQAVRQLGRGLTASAVAADNVIEAIEHQEAPFFVGVQWHAERALEDGANRRLFESLVRAATVHGDPARSSADETGPRSGTLTSLR